MAIIGKFSYFIVKYRLCVLIRIASRGDSNEYTQHTIIIQKIKKTSLSYIRLPPDMALWLALSGSNYPCLEQLYIVLKMLELLRIQLYIAGLGGAVGCASDWRPGGRGFDPRRGRQHSFVETDHEIFSTVILSLPLIQEGQLSVSGERMCTILVNRLED